MNWEAIGAIAEAVGAAGVVVTLVYLSIQIRANTAATLTASRLDVSRDYREINSSRLDLRNNSAFANGLRMYPNLPYEQRALFSTLIANEALFFQGVFALHEAGQLESETYEAYLLWFSALIKTPGGSAWWEEAARAIFIGRWLLAVDRRIERGPLPDVSSIANFRADSDAT